MWSNPHTFNLSLYFLFPSPMLFLYLVFYFSPIFSTFYGSTVLSKQAYVCVCVHHHTHPHLPWYPTAPTLAWPSPSVTIGTEAAEAVCQQVVFQCIVDEKWGCYFHKHVQKYYYACLCALGFKGVMFSFAPGIGGLFRREGGKQSSEREGCGSDHRKGENQPKDPW